jgi:hypothetical protein
MRTSYCGQDWRKCRRIVLGGVSICWLWWVFRVCRGKLRRSWVLRVARLLEVVGLLSAEGLRSSYH